MGSQFDYTQIRNSQDEQTMATLLSQCFGGTSELAQSYLNRLGKDNFRLLCQGEEIFGSLGIYQMGQWYGGRRVPMAGISAVGIAPEHRGKGVADQLMRQVILELHQLKVPISTLYPATQVLYRKVGYEQAGSYCHWELPLAGLKLPGGDLPIHSVTPNNDEAFQDIYTRKAQANNGNLDRHPALWEQIINPVEKQTIYAYLIGEKTQPEGYVIFTQNQDSGKFVLALRDWVVLTERATQRFWSFIAAHRSQITHVRWRGGLLEPSLLLLPEQTAKIIDLEYWMIRIIDVPKALSMRGYPPTLNAQLHLEVTDDLLQTNNGKFCLTISQGEAEVTPGGKGNFQIDIRGLNALYSGFLTAHQLELTGQLNATPESLATATMIFSGSNPWMSDFF
ncbi:GCN5-related N-acetyltransferase [Gloeothece citriformis PCC 7424]|uniref:GCN5-related N-acetyltransferase n=1 Tax=Gloeothece citriformis (strain PCC 7424) TaxID=65393 RepID=B7KIB1_GLOC7|nr:GNAT family N-acetyltransferase [Gloeothece citriformis]ACK73598.1 GCN5-related N-acetyltransferase [Gloeothece citriformis PCC 7424]